MPIRFIAEKKRPSMRNNRAAWEKSWENDFKRSYSSYHLGPALIAETFESDGLALYTSDSVIGGIHVHIESLLQLQRLTGKRANRAFILDNFELKWLALAPRKRREIVFEGLVCSMSSEADTERIWCPDSTVTHLTSRNGQTYLDMMRAIIPADLGPLKPNEEPKTVPNAMIDPLFTLSEVQQKQPGLRAAVLYAKISRARFLTEVLVSILQIFVRLFKHSRIGNALM